MSKKRLFSTFLGFSLVALAAFLLSGCKATRQVAEGEHLLVKNTIVLNQQDADRTDKIALDELEDIIKQKPNRGLVIPFYLYLHNFGSRGRDSSKIRKWFRKIGNPPVIVDHQLTEKTDYQLQLYLQKKGYYLAEVTDSTVYDSTLFGKPKKKAEVIYHVRPREPYRVKKITFSIDDSDLLEPIKKANDNTLLKPGMNADEYVFTKERKRMAEAMKNQGFYTFSEEFVYFQLDSTVGDKRVNIKQVIRNPKMTVMSSQGLDSIVETQHEKYTINQVFISADKGTAEDLTTESDTLSIDDYNLIYKGKPDYRPDILLKNIFINPGDLYSLRNTEYTYKRLAGLRTFKFINIRFEQNYDANNSLDGFIDLTAAPKRSFVVETEGTHRSGNLGVAATVITRNKNTFRGAEVLEFRLKGGLEAQTLSDEERENLEASGADTRAALFNTLEYGAEASLFIPELLRPKTKKFDPDYTEPKTNLHFAYNHQQRPFYDREIFNTALKYSWKTGDYHSFIFHPIDVSFIEIERDPVFDALLADINNTLLTNSYSDNLIPATRLSYIFSNQPLESERNFTFFRINFESAGNLLHALSEPLQLNQAPEGYYRALGVRYAQYVKTDVDLRVYQIMNEHSKMVYRGFAGIGIALENLEVMPFEKSFFAGGSNDQRAWTARALGPGSVSDSISFKAIDQIGDIVLGGNVEYRFDVFKYLEGAAFIDAGNIWLRQKDEKRPGGEFDLRRFYKEIAVGAGIGARLNLGFFTIRLDMGVPMHDPALPEGERWIWQPKAKYNNYYAEFLQKEDAKAYQNFIDQGGYRRFQPKFNLGIDYPF